MKRFFLVGMAIVSGIFASACAGPIGEGGNAFSHYLTSDTTVMLAAPGAKEPHEEVLRKGTRVRLVERGGATTLIETMGGELGRVPSLDIEEIDDGSGSKEPQAQMGQGIRW